MCPRFLSLLCLGWFCGSYAKPSTAPDSASTSKLKNYTAIAAAFLKDYEKEATKLGSAAGIASWNYETDMTNLNREMLVRSSGFAREFQLRASENASAIPYVDLSRDASRQIMLIRRNALPKSRKKIKTIDELQAQMTAIYSKGKACKYNNVTKESRCFDLDPDLSNLMAKSRDYDQLLWAWKGWRDSVGPPIKPLFKTFVGLLNLGAREQNWGDYGNFLRSEYEMGNDFQALLRKLWIDVKPLYQELHAYARYKLHQKYPRVPREGPVPAHVFGNMWAQEWSEIYDLLQPYPKLAPLDVTPNLIKEKYNVEQLFKLAQSFFVSLGLDPMPPSFWSKSVKTKPTNGSMVCHASAWDFCNGDVRIKMCSRLNQEDLITIHHEMGHCEYYLAYRDLLSAFREGANPGFHEAIGDTIALSVENPEHLKSVGLLYTVAEGKDADINFLMLQALRRVALLPFTYLVDQWRWKVFAGKVTSNDYNAEWWKLRRIYQGVTPPVARTENDFDPGAKYHVPANSPYISYFVSLILQFQFHRALCKIAKHEGPLHKCSIYKSKEAGQKFKEMLSAGRSRPWQQTLYHLTGEREMTASAILEYFTPLREWLFDYRNKQGYPIGWKKKELRNVAKTASGVRKTLPVSKSSSKNSSVNAKQPPSVPASVPEHEAGPGGHTTKESLNGVTFPEAKESNDAVNLGKPDLKAALADMGEVLSTQEDNIDNSKDTSLLHTKSAILGSSKPMFVPNKIKDQLNLGKV